MTPAQVEEFLTWAVLGIIAGGRLGYTLFYQPAYYLTHPVEILYVWQGGMSFHGGFLGIVAAAIWFSRRNAIPLAQISDALAIAAPAGIMLGRLANFVNAELWGRPTDLPWGVIFPGERAQDCPGVEGLCARHPSQLYEAGLEGLLLGAILLWHAFGRGWLRRPWALTGVFLAGYGAARTFVELFRVADAQYITPDNPLGHVVQFGAAGLSMGQLLSLPMMIVGLILILAARRQA
jgi:phosphatidylglycerol:prolipoprotein diacylglycerol transferase